MLGERGIGCLFLLPRLREPLFPLGVSLLVWFMQLLSSNLRIVSASDMAFGSCLGIFSVQGSVGELLLAVVMKIL